MPECMCRAVPAVECDGCSLARNGRKSSSSARHTACSRERVARTRQSRTPLSKQAGVLRASLLLSLGLTPLACGGTVVNGSHGNGGSSAGDAGGSSSYGGSSVLGGAPAGGTSAAGMSSTAGAGGTGGTKPGLACPNPVFDPATKLTTCSNGRAHRVDSLACTFTAPLPPNGEGGASSGGEAGAAGEAGVRFCERDTDCAGVPYGYCDYVDDSSGTMICKSGCVRDSDCGSGVCACNGENPGVCAGGSCWTDADCGPNSLCAPSIGLCGPSIFFACTSSLDECITSDDCEDDGRCVVEGGIRRCDSAVCGRPFLVAEAPRMAAVEPRTDWLDATLTPNVSELTPLERAELAAHWARLGQLEPASIAAFARFNLQLLSLGAPSRLVEACNRALTDETAHARSCFALASAYGGTAVGPARLDTERCFEDTSLIAIAKLVLREGCLGETVAALEATAAAESASDPAVKRALECVARDELDHAELAFQFLRWALSVSSAEVRHELASEAARQLADFESDAQQGERSASDERLAAHGLLGKGVLRAIHLAAVREVSRPLLASLFEVDNTEPMKELVI